MNKVVLNLRVAIVRLYCRRLLLIIVMLVLRLNWLCWELAFCSLLAVNGVECRLTVCWLLLAHVSFPSSYKYCF